MGNLTGLLISLAALSIPIVDNFPFAVNVKLIFVKIFCHDTKRRKGFPLRRKRDLD
ncbi:MAG: hypothetical protein FWF68_02210 [Spirochaetes bacterium]|nr:hypothetical protein [Spirochaetota bacterium]